MTPKVTIWCQRMSTYPNGPWIREKLDIFMFSWKVFFWPRLCTFDPGRDPTIPEDGYSPQPTFDSWKTRYFHVFMKNVLLTFDLWPPQTHKQTHFNFFRITLPSVEGISGLLWIISKKKLDNVSNLPERLLENRCILIYMHWTVCYFACQFILSSAHILICRPFFETEYQFVLRRCGVRYDNSNAHEGIMSKCEKSWGED